MIFCLFINKQLNEISRVLEVYKLRNCVVMLFFEVSYKIFYFHLLLDTEWTVEKNIC